MMISKGFISWLCLALSATPALAAVHEKWATTPKGWSKAGKASDSTSITLTISLVMQNIEQLESKLLAVSSPGSPSYGKYMDHDEINAMFAPSSDAVSSITNWLKKSGIKHVNVDGNFVDFVTDVATANSLLGASFQYYQNDGVTKLRTLQYSIPDEIQHHVDLVMPTTYFGSTTAFMPTRTVKAREEQAPTKPQVDASCQTSITPACLKELYNAVDYTPDPKSGSRVGFGSFLNQTAIYSDLDLFEKKFGIPQQSYKFVGIAGAKNDQNVTSVNQVGEANLDLEYIVGISHPLPVTEFSTGGSPPFVPNIDQPTPADNNNEPYVPYYRYLLSQPNSKLPQVITNSYGDEEDSVPRNYAVTTCNLIGLMGLRGITILESSGDLGVGAGCLAPDYKTVEFNAIFPATCPYLTSVGGTVNVTPEIAWEGSSGGFSKYFPRPAYQNKAISEYLSIISPETKAYYGNYTNFKGRGFPDVAAHSVSPDYFVYYLGKQYPSGGTSAASPVVAGLVAMLNDARFKAKKPALGFLNPLIYNIGNKAFTDIVGGYSIGCNGMNTQTGGSIPGGGIVPGARWNATTGWDPVTGFGTPNFQALKDVVLKL